MAEYAWQQPDGEIAPVLATEGYELMINIVGDWVRVADLVKLALQPGQMGNPAMFYARPDPNTGGVRVVTGDRLADAETGRWIGPDGKPCDHGHIWTMDDESGRYQCACGKLMSKF